MNKNKTAPLSLILVLISLLLAACSSASDATPAATTAPTSAADVVEESQQGINGTLEAAGVIETRAPRPTATPDVIAETVDTLVEDTRFEELAFLGLTSADWINLGISLLIVIIGFIIGSWLSRAASNYLSRYLVDEKARTLLKKTAGLLRWLIVLWALEIAIIRLLFLGPGLKQGLETIIFVVAIILLTRAGWLLIDMATAEAEHRFSDAGREEEMSPVITLLKRIVRVILVLVATTALLSQFGINMTAFAALIGLGGLAFSLAARDTIADAIAGVIILLDRPFRVGDRIEISAANTWGDVTDIGLRTTRILTRDNRLVIIPNSLISKNEIINYTYPDPNYRIQTHVGIAYDTDINEARTVMRDAVRQVPDVLENKPVDILYNDMGDSAMIFRVRWWIETYADTRRITDKVHSALQRELDAAGIDMPFPTQSVLLYDEDVE